MNRMQRKVKRALACTLAVATVAGMNNITANAQKRQFSFKTRPGISGRTAPAHKSDDEQKAYVTITYLSRSQPTCMGVDNGSQNGIATTNWTFTDLIQGKELDYYSGYADMKTTFYLYYEGYGSGARAICGRYNP